MDKQVVPDDHRFRRWEIAAVLLAALLGSGAGVAGAFVAANSSSDALAQQLQQDRIAALRTERAEVFRKYLAAAQQQSPGFGDVTIQPSDPITFAYKARLKYELLREQALLYASDDQYDAIRELDEAIATLRTAAYADSADSEDFERVVRTRKALLDLLRADLQFRTP